MFSDSKIGIACCKVFINAIVMILLVASSSSTAVWKPNSEKSGVTSNLLIGFLGGYNDNLFLDTTDQKKVYVQHVMPHFDLDYRTAKFTVNLDYTGDYRWYSEGGERLKNLMHFSRMNASWRWHRDFTLQLSADVSDRAIDLSKGGGIISTALRLGEYFRPPAVNSVLVNVIGARQWYSRQINSRTYLEAGYSVTDLKTRGKIGRDVFYHGPSVDILYTVNKRLDTSLRYSLTRQDYEGDIHRDIDLLFMETSYSITPRISLLASIGIERLEFKQAEGEASQKSNLYLDINLAFEKIPRTSVSLDYKRRFYSDINARVFKIDEIGLRLSHDLSQRLMLSSGLFSRSLSLVETDLDLRDWIMGVEWQARYKMKKDIQPVISINYVFNRGKVKINDFDNLRITTGFRYYFFSLN